MKKAVSVIILSVFIAAAFFPAAAFADDGSLVETAGGTVRPLYETDIEMEEEIIDIVVRDGCSYVNCQFFFHNTGKSTNLLVGFPLDSKYVYKEEEDYGQEWDYEVVVPNLNWFRTFINGKRVPIKIKNGLKPKDEDDDSQLYYAKWYTWRMRFSAGERIKVVNKYWVKNPINYGSGSEFIRYILRSGSIWKGPIGKVTVRMRLEGYDFAGVELCGMQPTYIEEDGTIFWTAENLEPQYDIDVYCGLDYNDNDYDYYNDPFDSYMYGIGNQFKHKTQKCMWDKYRKMGNRLLRNFYAGGYNGVTWWGNKFFKAFEDKQSSGLYYYMGVSYYKLGYNEKALEMFGRAEKEKDIYYIMSAYYKALICKEAGDNEGYLYNTNILKEYNALADSAYEEGYVLEFSGMWVKSRLSDLRE